MNASSEAAVARAAAPAIPHRRLRNLVLDASLQLRLGGYLGAIVAALSGALCWQVWGAYRETSRLLALGDPRTDEAAAAMLLAQDRARMLWTVGILAGILVCLLVMAVVITHRIAGPAHALAATCREVAAGPLAPPRPLRRRDLLIGLADEVGAMVAALRQREEEERAALREALDNLPRAAGRARELLERLEAEKTKRLKA